jgi:Tol biopolymer transport system component
LVGVDNEGNPLEYEGWMGGPTPAVSTDGRFVAFNDIYGKPGASNILVRDRVAGTTEAIHVTPQGEPVSADTCFRFAMSADGRFVAFDSDSDELVPGDYNEESDVFLRDRLSAETIRLSVNASGEEGERWEQSAVPSISGDGRTIGFRSYADLVEGGHLYYIRDLRAQTIEAFEGDSWPVFNHDGRYAAYDHHDGIGVMHRVTGEVDSAAVGEVQFLKAISANGRFVAFSTETKGIAPGDDDWDYDVFVYDRLTGELEAVSVSTEGELGDEDSIHPAISADGRYVAFASRATNLVPGPTGAYWQVFIRDRGPQTCEARITVTGDNGHIEVDGTPQALPWSEIVPCESMVTLWAVPDDCHEFSGWSGDLSGTENPVTIVVDADTSITAVFGFSDVPCDYWSAAEIGACVDAGVVSGYGDGTYLPEEPVSRAAMAVYLARAEGWVSLDDDMGTAPALLSDVPAGHWAGTAILECLANNVVAGYADGTYRPLDSVTRDQMAVYVARALVAPAGDPDVPGGPPTPTFPDVPLDYWAYDHIESCVGQGVVSGFDGGQYHPEGVVSRGQMAVYIARAFELPM